MTKFDVQDVSVTTMEDTPISVQVPVVANSQVQASITTPPAHGTLTSDDNGAATIYTYTPTANYNGPDTIAVTFDNGKEQKVGHIAVTISPVNDPPTAGPDSFATGFSMPLTVQSSTLLMNDTDPESMPLSVTGVSAGGHGSVALNAGAVVFTPESGFQGTASFTYDVSDGMATGHGQVSVTIGTNHPPVAVNDTATATEDTAVTIPEATLLANDTDPDSNTLAVSGFRGATHGTVTLVGTSLTFMPDANYNGAASFQYTVTDGLDTATGTVNVNVAAVNDPPVVGADTATTPEDTALVLSTATLLANDSDVDGTVSVSAVSGASSGTVSLSNGSVTYTPGLNFNGTATFTYTASDGSATTNGTVTVNVTPVNDAPVAVDDSIPGTEDTTAVLTPLMLTGNDTDVDGDALSVTAVGNANHGVVSMTGGVITFVPVSNYNGPATFDYTVSDGPLSDTGTVTLNLGAVNDAPTAVNDTLVTNEDTAITAPVVINDLDIDGDALTVSAVTAPQHGQVTFSGGSVTYTPFQEYSGPDTFTYTTNDGHGGTAIATVSVTVNPVDDPPVAVTDTLTTPEDTAGSIDPIANDTDIDGANLTLVTVGTAAHGVVTLNGSTVSYTPALNYNGPDSISYRVSDNAGQETNGVISVNVTPVNDAPVGANDTYFVQDTSVPFVVTATAGVLINDHDVDNTVLTATLLTNASHGDLTFNADGSFTYTVHPEDPCPIQDSFTYTTSDGQLSTPAITVTINLNRAPIAESDSFQADFVNNGSGGSGSGAYLVVDAGSGINYDIFDPNGDPLTVTLVDPPTDADNFVLNSDGSFFYLTHDTDPTCNPFGPYYDYFDSFTYTASDGTLTSEVATIDIYTYNYCSNQKLTAGVAPPPKRPRQVSVATPFEELATGTTATALGPCCFINQGNTIATGVSNGKGCFPSAVDPTGSTTVTHATSAVDGP